MVCSIELGTGQKRRNWVYIVFGNSFGGHVWLAEGKDLVQLGFFFIAFTAIVFFSKSPDLDELFHEATRLHGFSRRPWEFRSVDPEDSCIQCRDWSPKVPVQTWDEGKKHGGFEPGKLWKKHDLWHWKIHDSWSGEMVLMRYQQCWVTLGGVVTRSGLDEERCGKRPWFPKENDLPVVFHMWIPVGSMMLHLLKWGSSPRKSCSSNTCWTLGATNGLVTTDGRLKQQLSTSSRWVPQEFARR